MSVLNTKRKAPEYLAFISYSHLDVEWAKWLQEKLEFYKLPAFVAEEYPQLPLDLRPIFRDQTDLQLGDLSEVIKKALDSSRFLIVVCSKNSAISDYVNFEIIHFLRKHRVAWIIPFIVDGVPNSSTSNDECFPPKLRELGVDLLGANINELGKDYAAVKVVSKLLGGIDIHRLWDRYQEAAEEERKRLKDTNNKLLELASRASSIKARELFKGGSFAVAIKVALENYSQNEENEHGIPPEVECLIRLASVGDAGEFFSSCHYQTTEYISTKVICFDDCRLFVWADDLKLYLLDAVSLRKQQIGFGVLFDDTETLCFSDDGSHFLNCSFREFAIYDITNQVLSPTTLIFEVDDKEVAKKAFIFRHEAIIIVSGNFVKVYDFVSRELFSSISITNIIDAYLFGSYLIVIRQANNHVSFTAEIITLTNMQANNLKPKFLANGLTWSATCCRTHFALLIDNRLFVFTQQQESICLFVEGTEYKVLDISDEGIVVLFDKSTQKVLFINIHNSCSTCLDSIEQIFISHGANWGIYMNKQNHLFFFEVHQSSSHLFISSLLVHSAHKDVKEILISPKHQEVLIIYNNICFLFDRVALRIVGERCIPKDVNRILFTSVYNRYLFVESQGISLVEWNPLVMHFDFHPTINWASSFIERDVPFRISAYKTDRGRRQFYDYPASWGNPSTICDESSFLDCFATLGLDTSCRVKVKDSDCYFIKGDLYNSNNEKIISCEDFVSENAGELVAILPNGLQMLAVGAKYPIIAHCVLYIWSLISGKLLFTYTIEDPRLTLEYNSEHQYFVFGYHVFEYPSLSELVSRARALYNDIELSETERLRYFLL